MPPQVEAPPAEAGNVSVYSPEAFSRQAVSYVQPTSGTTVATHLAAPGPDDMVANGAHSSNVVYMVPSHQGPVFTSAPLDAGMTMRAWTAEAAGSVPVAAVGGGVSASTLHHAPVPAAASGPDGVPTSFAGGVVMPTTVGIDMQTMAYGGQPAVYLCQTAQGPHQQQQVCQVMPAQQQQQPHQLSPNGMAIICQAGNPLINSTK